MSRSVAALKVDPSVTVPWKEPARGNLAGVVDRVAGDVSSTVGSPKPIGQIPTPLMPSSFGDAR